MGRSGRVFFSSANGFGSGSVTLSSGAAQSVSGGISLATGPAQRPSGGFPSSLGSLRARLQVASLLLRGSITRPMGPETASAAPFLFLSGAGMVGGQLLFTAGAALKQGSPSNGGSMLLMGGSVAHGTSAELLVTSASGPEKTGHVRLSSGDSGALQGVSGDLSVATGTSGAGAAGSLRLGSGQVRQAAGADMDVRAGSTGQSPKAANDAQDGMLTTSAAGALALKSGDGAVGGRTSVVAGRGDSAGGHVSFDAGDGNGALAVGGHGYVAAGQGARGGSVVLASGSGRNGYGGEVLLSQWIWCSQRRSCICFIPCFCLSSVGTGTVSFTTGRAAERNSGSLKMQTGAAHAKSGDVELLAGSAATKAGSVNITSGSSKAHHGGGNITIHAGSAPFANAGVVQIQAGGRRG